MLFTPLAGSSCGVDLWGRLVGSKLAERSPKPPGRRLVPGAIFKKVLCVEHSSKVI